MCAVLCVFFVCVVCVVCVVRGVCVVCVVYCVRVVCCVCCMCGMVCVVCGVCCVRASMVYRFECLSHPVVWFKSKWESWSQVVDRGRVIIIACLLLFLLLNTITTIHCYYCTTNIPFHVYVLSLREYQVYVLSLTTVGL